MESEREREIDRERERQTHRQKGSKQKAFHGIILCPLDSYFFRQFLIFERL